MKLDNVTIAFTTKNILKNATLEIRPGEFVFIVGSSGSGKTSLIRAITWELAPKQGHILDNNKRDIYALSPRELQAYRRKIGIIFQDYKLLRQRTVRENVAFAMEICGYADDHVMKTTPEILERVGILRKKDAFVEHLSGGECQRVAIARALIHDPDIIIGDEPTGNLDPENAHVILNILLDLNKKGKTIIIATHDLTLVNTLKKRVIEIRNESIYRDEQWGLYKKEIDSSLKK